MVFNKWDNKMKKILILGRLTPDLIITHKLTREQWYKIAKDQIEITILNKSNTADNKASFTCVPFGYLTEQDW